MKLIRSIVILIISLFIFTNANVIAFEIQTDLNMGNNQYDMLIITANILINDFAPLINRHAEDGLTTFTYAVEEIYENYEGVDKAEKIRNFIRYAKETYGIQYVLLGGDCQIVPARNLFLEKEYSNFIWVYRTGPSDVYYSCLEGSYNSDGDEYWGEPEDGEDGGDVDLTADVYVGRACVDDSNDVDNFVSKTIDYMDSGSDEYIKELLLAGEWMSLTAVFVWGAELMEELIDECDKFNYYTKGIPSNRFNIDKLYDKDWKENGWPIPNLYSGGWPKEEMISRINSEFHIINHMGHSTWDMNMKMDIDDIGELNNDKTCFIYSHGCYSGAFDKEDCMAEHFTVKSENGAFAGIWNSKYGWARRDINDEESPSQRFNREFWDAVFREGIHVISKAHADSKEDNIEFINENKIRYCFNELNYFGDPAIEFHIPDVIENKAPESPKIERISINDNEAYRVTSTDPDDDQIFYMFDWGEGPNGNWIGPFESGESYEFEHSYVDILKVKAKDEFGHESDWSTNTKTRLNFGDFKFLSIFQNIFKNFNKLFLITNVKINL